MLAIGIWSLIALMLFQVREQTLQSAASAGHNLARSLAEYEASSVRTIDIALRYLRDDWYKDAASFGAAVQRLEENLKREKVIQVAVVDADGWLSYSKLPQRERINFSDREYFRLHRARAEDELFISEPVFGRITQQWAIQLSRPIFSEAKRFAGMIVVAVPPPALEDVYGDIELGAQGIIMLVRSDGRILARTGGFSAGMPSTLSGRQGLAQDAPVAGGFEASSPVDGIRRLYSYRKLEGYPLTVFVAPSMDQVLAPYYAQRRIVVGGAALATLLLFAVVFLLVRREKEKESAEQVRARLEREVIEGERRFLEARERLALDLHDSCIQSIYAIGLSLENTRRLAAQDPAKAAQGVAESQANLNLVIQDLRGFIAGGAPSRPTEEEFIAQLQAMVPAPAGSVPEFSLAIDPAAVAALGAEQAEHVMRIAREAISNAVRHSRAKSARLSLRLDGGAIRLEVKDDGVGMGAQATAGPGLGLHNISARARKLGGRSTIDSSPGKGTRLVVEFPGKA